LQEYNLKFKSLKNCFRHWQHKTVNHDNIETTSFICQRHHRTTKVSKMTTELSQPNKPSATTDSISKQIKLISQRIQDVR